MASRNSRTNRPVARSSRAPQSARAVRSAKAAQSGRIASRGTAEQFSRGGQQASPSAYRSAYTPGSQGRSANTAYSRQTAASQYSRNNPQYSRNAGRRMGRGKKIAIGVLAAVLVAVVGCGTAFALYVNSINSELSGNKTSEEMQAIQDVLAPKKSFDEPFYMLLVGSDERAGSDEDGARSDTNIVVYVDPTRNQVSLLSIPRDTMIEIDDVGRAKFNAAFNYGGVSATIREASQLLNVDISHYAEVNFDNLIDLVDAVGGVDVEVTERIDDPDADNSSWDPNAEPVILEEGMHHLNGREALVFARSRAYADGDFTRTSNQRALIMAIVNKVLELPVTELPGIIQSAAKCVSTDLSVTDIVALAQQFKDKGGLTVYSAMVPTVFMDQLVDGQSYVLNDPTATKQMIKTIEEGGDPSGIVGVTGSGPGGYSNGTGSTGSSSSHLGSTGSGNTGYYSEAYSEDYEPNYEPNYGSQTQGGGSDYDSGYDYSEGYEDYGGNDYPSSNDGAGYAA
ncbi:LCP family protein [Gordonibacter massiliensis (ex Traore et al. 2017)]|uniref:LCP family protein n=1 Tax=Gordonibacter massiliensis (ex Traore et al. 2017) TaxID=1841863 RepID=UPI001FE95E19|nr:LCP family protein [Gordonibacter massiliensis (ex Traore et al. 2017)]